MQILSSLQIQSQNLLLTQKRNFQASINGFSLLSFHPLLKLCLDLIWIKLSCIVFVLSFRPGMILLFLLRQGKC